VRYAVISDVHSNLEALHAVLKEAEEIGYDEILCLGDFVGYNADPVACLRILQRKVKHAVLGNHDAAALNPSVADYFNTYAREAVLWARERLTPVERSFLAGLPLTANPEEDVLLVHSSPHNPEMWSYILSEAEADLEFGTFEEPVCLFGHSHVAGAFVREGTEMPMSTLASPLRIEKGKRYLINPGSVGQPRDGDQRAALGILDTESNFFEFHRVEYDVETAKEKILEAGLPRALALRLDQGI
jgi:diadenosine tetraphosphatase ApaH/serine/threonine PP2A family protein phosphatase